MTARPWLWPDHSIGKRESRRLREEHNAAVNELGTALDLLSSIVNHAAHEDALSGRRVLMVRALLERNGRDPLRVKP